jgi:type I restriction enzyme S subunit
MSNTPQIRFAGFTDAWEQRKLSDMVERVTRKNENLESELPLTISAQYGLIDQNEFFDKRIASRDVSGYYLLKKGEFAYNKSTSSDAPWGAVKRLDRYEMGVLSTLYIVFALKEDGNIDSDFLVSYYDTDCWHKGVQAIAAEGARNHGLLNITPADYFETVLTVPSDVKEQHQIGTFFAKLDTLITLQRRECFSFDFSGESAKTAQKTISWEQRELGECMETVTDYVAAGSFADIADHVQYKNSPDYAQLIRTVDLKHEFRNSDYVYVDKKAFDYLWRVNLNEECIVLPNIGANIGEVYYIAPLSLPYEFNVLGPNAILLKTKDSTKFMFTLLQADDFQNKLYVSIASSGQPKFNKTELKSIKILMPQPDEQEKIGAFFSKLDNLITLHQHKPNKKGHDVLSVMPFKGNQRKPHYLCT